MTYILKPPLGVTKGSGAAEGVVVGSDGYARVPSGAASASTVAGLVAAGWTQIAAGTVTMTAPDSTQTSALINGSLYAISAGVAAIAAGDVTAAQALGWVLQGGGTSFPQDGSGNYLVNVVPRTGTLAGLLTTQMGVGELATATDQNAVVVGSGSAPVAGTATANKIISAMGAVRAQAIIASTPQNVTLYADCAKVQLSISGVSTVTLPINTASPAAPVAGQEFAVWLASTGSGAITLNGVSLGVVVTSATSQPVYRFRFDGTVWQVIGVDNATAFSNVGGLTIIGQAAVTPGSGSGGLAIADSGSTYALQNSVGQSVLVGTNSKVYRTNAMALGSTAIAAGYGSVAAGRTTFSVGDYAYHAGSSAGAAGAFGAKSLAIQGGVAGGYGSAAIRGGVTGYGSSFENVSASTATASGATAITVTLTTVANGPNYVAGDVVTLKTATAYYSGSVTTTGTTGGVIVLALSTAEQAGLSLAANAITGIINSSVGAFGMAGGISANGVDTGGANFSLVAPNIAIQRGEFTWGCTGFGGAYPPTSAQNITGQWSMAGLVGQIAASTAAGPQAASECTLDSGLVNAGKQPGSSNRWVIPADGLTTRFVCDIIAKQEATANFSSAQVTFACTRNAGTVTLTALQVTGAVISNGTATVLAAAPIAVNVITTNAGYPALQFLPALTTVAAGAVDVFIGLRAFTVMGA